MAINNYLDSSDFFTYAGLTKDDVNCSYVEYLIDKFNASIVQKLTKLFVLSAGFTNKYYPENTSSIFPVGTWQESGLVVKQGLDGDATLDTLTEGEDFRFIYFSDHEPTRTYPVVGIKMYSDCLAYDEYLQLEGTYGFQDGIPSETMLDMQLYDLLKKAVLSSESETNSGGKGPISSSKIDKIQTSFDNALGYEQGEKMSTQSVMKQASNILDGIVTNYEINGDYLTTVIG